MAEKNPCEHQQSEAFIQITTFLYNYRIKNLKSF